MKENKMRDFIIYFVDTKITFSPLERTIVEADTLANAKEYFYMYYPDCVIRSIDY